MGISISLRESTKNTAPYLAIREYCSSLEDLGEMSDYIVINLTGCKPSAGLDQFKDRDSLEALLCALKQKREEELGIQSACEYELKLDAEAPRKRGDIPTMTRLYGKNGPSLTTHEPAMLFIKVNSDFPDPQAVVDLALKYSIDGIIVGSTEVSLRSLSAFT